MIVRILLLLAIATTTLAQDSTSILAPDSLNKALMSELNKYRIRNLRLPVTYNPNPKRQASTEIWAKAISKRFLHRAGNYEECIAKSYTPEDIIPQFMASAPHRKALLSMRAMKVTIAVYAVPIRTKKYESIYPYAYYTVIRTYRRSDL